MTHRFYRDSIVEEGKHQLFKKGRAAKVVFVVLLALYSICSDAQLPEYLELEKPRIFNACIASGGRVWNTATKEIILSVGYKVSLTANSIYFSDGGNTFIHSNVDGQMITQIPGKDFTYNPFSALIWRYSDGRFDAYSEVGQPVASLTASGSNMYAFEDEIRFVKNSTLYKYAFAGAAEESVGSFEGTFSTWFMDGEYFLTLQGTTVRLYSKNGLLIKFVDAGLVYNHPLVQSIGGNGSYFWTYKIGGSFPIQSVNLYRVNDATVKNYPVDAFIRVFPTPESIAMQPFGVQQFSIVSLEEAGPVVTTHVGAGPYLTAYDADRNGNWTTANQSGVVNYSVGGKQPEKLNPGKIRSLSGNKNGDLAIATSSGHVVIYNFDGTVVSPADTFALNVGSVKLSQDGKYFAAGGNTADFQYNEDELSLRVYDVTTSQLIREWYYNPYHDNTPSLDGFDFSPAGSFVTQKVSEWDGSNWSFVNFRSSIHAEDSIFLNDDNNYTTPKLSLSGSYVATSVLGPENAPGASKIYAADGSLVNQLSGPFGGWVSDDRFIFNRFDSMRCLLGSCTKFYTPKVYSVDGKVDLTFNLPAMRRVDNVISITDVEVVINDGYIINMNTGKIVFAFDDARMFVPVGPDHLAFVADNKIDIINWRLQSTQTWFKDADGDGFGNPAITMQYFKKPVGFVGNDTDCNDNDITVTPLNGCGVTAAEEPAKETNVFPNPGNGVYYFRHNGTTAEFTIYNQMGQVVDTHVVRDDENYRIDISRETRGLYILNVKRGNDNVSTKVIKN